jgi:hypothetical protein
VSTLDTRLAFQANDQPVGLGAQYTLTYASQGLPGVHLTICSYAGVSPHLNIKSWLMAQIIFSTTIQWLVYGNHPSIVAFVGIAVISAAGLCSVVSHPYDLVVMPTTSRFMVLPAKSKEMKQGIWKSGRILRCHC